MSRLSISCCVLFALIVQIVSSSSTENLRGQKSSKVSSTYGTEDDLIVDTTLGMVKGHVVYSDNGIPAREWKGLKFAAAPVGDMRWEYPVPAAPYDDGFVYEANFDAPGCPQLCNLPPGTCPEHGQSEDCLYLTVHSPLPGTKLPNGEDPPEEGYPVYFFMHGGAFTQGIGTCALYNGTTFAELGIVTVVVNYRLGALGFMASPSMQGNYGIMDQRLAMQWVQDNIAQFGGDPKRVTISGQSAGSMSVGTHRVSPGSAGLFSQVIMESNPLALPYHTRTSATENAAAVFEYCDCAADDVACMREASIDCILEAQNNAIELDLDNLLLNFLPFAPLVDPRGEVPEQPFTALANGRVTDPYVPQLQGSLTDEGQLFVYELFTAPVSEVVYKILVAGIFGTDKAKEILQMYPMDLVENSTDAREVLNILATDLIFLCPLRNISRGMQQSVIDKAPIINKLTPPTFVYQFKHIMSFDMWGENYTFCVGYACHGSELPLTFNVYTDGAGVYYSPSDEELQLSKDMMHAWANFMYTGNPNLGGNELPVKGRYPLYTAKRDELIRLDEPDYSLEFGVRSDYCDVWDRLGYFY